jgi:hypothetical protein
MKMIRAEGAVGWINARSTRFAPLALEIRSRPVQKCPHDCAESMQSEFF